MAWTICFTLQFSSLIQSGSLDRNFIIIITTIISIKEMKKVRKSCQFLVSGPGAHVWDIDGVIIGVESINKHG